jgi:nucleotide-binding universal stress UspA family protein
MGPAGALSTSIGPSFAQPKRREGSPLGTRTILAAVDLSAVTGDVVARASELARAMGGRLLLLHVLQIPSAIMECPEAIQLMAGTEKDAAARLDEIARSLPGVRAQGMTATGIASEEILRESRDNAVDVIVVGSHGHTAIYDLLVGSTTHGVLMRAPCPVLVVPAQVAQACAPSPATQPAIAVS